MSETAIEKVGARTGDRPAPKGAPRKSRAKAIPDGAKKPADHQPAKNDVVEPAPKTIVWGTQPGEPNEDGTPGERTPAEYVIDPLAFDDLDFVEALIAVDEASDNGTRGVQAYRALRFLLGPEQLDAYKRNERDPETGRIKFSGTATFFEHIMKEMNQGNS